MRPGEIEEGEEGDEGEAQMELDVGAREAAEAEAASVVPVLRRPVAAIEARLRAWRKRHDAAEAAKLLRDARARPVCGALFPELEEEASASAAAARRLEDARLVRSAELRDEEDAKSDASRSRLPTRSLEEIAEEIDRVRDDLDVEAALRGLATEAHAAPMQTGGIIAFRSPVAAWLQADLVRADVGAAAGCSRE